MRQGESAGRARHTQPLWITYRNRVHHRPAAGRFWVAAGRGLAGRDRQQRPGAGEVADVVRGDQLDNLLQPSLVPDGLEEQPGCRGGDPAPDRGVTRGARRCWHGRRGGSRRAEIRPLEPRGSGLEHKTVERHLSSAIRSWGSVPASSWRRSSATSGPAPPVRWVAACSWKNCRDNPRDPPLVAGHGRPAR